MPNMQSPNQVIISSKSGIRWIRGPCWSGPRSDRFWSGHPFLVRNNQSIFSLQRKYLEQIEDLYCDFHITKIPLFETEVRGISRLHHMSNLLAPGNEKGWLWWFCPVILSGFYFDDPSRTPYKDVPSCNKEFINQFYYKNYWPIRIQNGRSGWDCT